jgi:hypothetical protein
MLRGDHSPTVQHLKNGLAQARTMHEQFGANMDVCRRNSVFAHSLKSPRPCECYERMVAMNAILHSPDLGKYVRLRIDRQAGQN